MAPVIPSKRRTLRAKLAARSGPSPYAPRKAPRPDAVETSDSFINSKKDKRLVKHASFVSRIEKTSSKEKKLKRRRPGKKLVTNLDALADALPDLMETEEGLRQMREGRVRHRSLKGGRGAMKRKERVVRGEVRRFGVSLARLNAVPEKGGEVERSADVEGQGEVAVPVVAPTSTANRFAALRSFISATMEQNPAFVGKRDGE
ncbi:ribosome biogenesis protein SLX9-domain-containing protein [Annulohypoxylon maeteangense]|uniref:ribosome biogenesis protein SLX9-domain-containing protein n=1 Tax=Annulohypoxylon maeteangense TaxID=1927788 RepID=UPI0020083C67|nr:ribosome biogenesis protein SLX9-domain-containing protein [Annulohypoxylon maeteangense]KAI0890086.1 ribosome biogenesis protein SLX9-domain-containing protein [Annulohypoxylon maeteangense]